MDVYGALLVVWAAKKKLTHDALVRHAVSTRHADIGLDTGQELSTRPVIGIPKMPPLRGAPGSGVLSDPQPAG